MWKAGHDWAVLTERTERRGAINRYMIVFCKVGRLYRRSFENHWAAVYSADEVKKELRRAGFSVITRRTYGKFELPPRRTAFFATKQA
jgi:hypothetical protein